MKALSLTAVVLAIPILILAQNPGQRAKFGDRKDNFAILNFTSQLVEGNINEGFTFTFGGNPVSGYSRSQGLEFSAKTISGRAVSDKSGGLLLRNATASGGVVVDIERTEDAGTKIIGKLTTSTATIDDPGSAATIKIPSAFTYTQTDTDKAEKRVITMNGSSGTVVVDTLKAISKSPLRSANIVGRVKVVIKVTDLKDGKSTTTDMEATGDRLTYDGNGRVMVLSGNVVFDGSQNDNTGAGFLGQMNADKLTVWFQGDKFEVKNIKLEGGPGTATVQDRPPKTGGQKR